MEENTITYLKAEGEETTYHLWATPLVIAKPFSKEFMAQLKEDVKRYLKDRNDIGNLNQTDLWQLPDLPETMKAVRDKKLELAEKAFRPGMEMPLPPFRASKGYFRVTYPDSPYRIMPHHHGNCYAVGIIYINVDERNPGNLMFVDPRGGVQWTNQFTSFKKVRVEEGLMIVHPGYLIHFVEPSNPQMGMYYGNRLGLITNIHRDRSEWENILKEQDEFLMKMGGADI